MLFLCVFQNEISCSIWFQWQTPFSNLVDLEQKIWGSGDKIHIFICGMEDNLMLKISNRKQLHQNNNDILTSGFNRS